MKIVHENDLPWRLTKNSSAILLIALAQCDASLNIIYNSPASLPNQFMLRINIDPNKVEQFKKLTKIELFPVGLITGQQLTSENPVDL